MHIYFYDANKEFGVFSNFYPAPIKYKGKTYQTSEHLYQAFKFMYSGASKKSLEYAEIIRTSSTPNKAKILASQKIAGGYAWRTALNPIIKKYQDVPIYPNWEDVKIKRMQKVLKLKFLQNPQCLEILMSTCSAKLSEHTTRDLFWGDGGDRQNGRDMLGKLLMKLRKEIETYIK